MLHEPATPNSATRLFAGTPVLAGTLDRLAQVGRAMGVVILCRDDQLVAVRPIAEAAGADVRSIGASAVPPHVHAIAAARRWADGWRGGPLAACDFDLGFHAGFVLKVAKEAAADAVLLIDPAAAFVDPDLIDRVFDQAEVAPDQELIFAPVAPSLAGPLLRMSLIERLAQSAGHPGKMLHYHPDVLSREPLSTPACVPAPVKAARTLLSFAIRSDRQAAKLAPAASENAGIRAEALVDRIRANDSLDALPRDVVLELNTVRLSRPIYWPGRHLAIARPDLSLDSARHLVDELAELDDTRLTLAGVGDPILSDVLFDVIAMAHAAGLAVNVETDLLGPVDAVRRLAGSGVDIVSVHLPALTESTYETVMGVPSYHEVMGNLQAFVAERAGLNSGPPVLIPLFTKCRENLAEMEAWYDQWLRAVGSAAILGPGDYGAQIPDTAVSDMAPPMRVACRRLTSRITVLSDGNFVTCEQDVLGLSNLGMIDRDRLKDVWRDRMKPVREANRSGRLNVLPLCGSCREWHRP